MKASLLAVCATGAVVLLSAFAENRTSPALHPESLARFDAIASYCQTLDPADGPRFASRLADLTRGHSEDEIAADRNSSKYREAALDANRTLARASQGAGIRGCSEFLAQK